MWSLGKLSTTQVTGCWFQLFFFASPVLGWLLRLVFLFFDDFSNAQNRSFFVVKMAYWCNRLAFYLYCVSMPLMGPVYNPSPPPAIPGLKHVALGYHMLIVGGMAAILDIFFAVRECVMKPTVPADDDEELSELDVEEVNQSMDSMGSLEIQNGKPQFSTRNDLYNLIAGFQLSTRYIIQLWTASRCLKSLLWVSSYVCSSFVHSGLWLDLMLDLIEILKLSHMLAFILIVQLVEVVHGLFSDGFMEDKNLRQAPMVFPIPLLELHSLAHGP